MPIPKGINDPAVRALWLAGRRDKLAEFDRLMGKGYGVTKAARAIGMSVASVVTWQDEDRQHGAQRERIDLGLALLFVLRQPGERLSLEDIAAWCDCPQQSIARIERRALRKLRQRLAECDLRADAGLEESIPFPVGSVSRVPPEPRVHQHAHQSAAGVRSAPAAHFPAFPPERADSARLPFLSPTNHFYEESDHH